MAAQAALKLEAPAELISISEIARRCRLDKATVRSRLDDLGYEADPSSTEKLKLFPFDSEMETAIRSAKDSLSGAKIRDLRVRAQINELKLAEARKELVPMAETVEIVQRIVKTIYEEFTVRQPKRIAPKLAKAKNVTAVKKVLKTDTDRVMKSLRENFDRFVEG